MKTIKLLILAFSLFLGTNLSATECSEMPTECFDIPANCFEMKIVPVVKAPKGFAAFEITIIVNDSNIPANGIAVSDGIRPVKLINSSTTFIWWYTQEAASYNVTIVCGTYGNHGCNQMDSCIVIVDGCC